jgi:hypothetical protein
MVVRPPVLPPQPRPPATSARAERVGDDGTVVVVDASAGATRRQKGSAGLRGEIISLRRTKPAGVDVLARALQARPGEHPCRRNCATRWCYWTDTRRRRKHTIAARAWCPARGWLPRLMRVVAADCTPGRACAPGRQGLLGEGRVKSLRIEGRAGEDHGRARAYHDVWRRQL